MACGIAGVETHNDERLTPIVYCTRTEKYEMPAKKKGKNKGKGGGKGETERDEGGGKPEPTGKEQELRRE